MSTNIINLYLLLFLLYNNIISSYKYPVNANIENSEFGNIKTLLIKSEEQYLDIILKSNYVISLTEYTINEKEPKIISIFDKLSSYKILKDWNFLRIQCYEVNDLCNLLSQNVTNKTIPSIKIYVKSQEIKTSKIIVDFNTSDFLEYLLKLSSNPIIEIKNNNINGFYENYGKFSPLVYYNQKNTEFISCINLLAKKKYFKNFYFGTNGININDTDIKKEKIIFDFDNMPISMTWERDCDDIDKFFEQNKYPLLSKIDKELINNLMVDQKILVLLVGFTSTNVKIINFINNEFKKLSYSNRDLVFGFYFYNEIEQDNYIMNRTKFKFISQDKNGMKIVLYNFYDDLYYIHPIVYKINETNSDIIFNRMNNIVSHYSNFPFTCGSFFKDLLRKIGIYNFIYDRNKIIALCSTVIIIVLGFLYLCIFGKCKF